MAFTKETASLAGQKSSRKGISNKSTELLRKHFASLVENNLERLQVDLDKLKPLDRLKILIELSKLVLPQLKSIDVNAPGAFTPIQINLITDKENEDGNDN